MPVLPLPVARPALPAPPPRAEPQNAPAASEAVTITSDNVARDHESTAVEPQRAEPEVVQLSDSDSDEDLDKVPIQPIITVNGVACDETDGSPSISNAVTVTELLTNATVTSSSGDEPAICADNSIACNDATVSDKSQMSFDEILQIDESLRCDDDGSDIEPDALNESIIVEIHDVPTIELKIHESDSDESAFSTMKATKEATIVTSDGLLSIGDVGRERSYSEDDPRDMNDGDEVKPDERLVQSDSEILTKTPIELVVKCDINENVVLDDGRVVEIVDLDHNHNDIVKCMDDSDVETVHSDADTVHSTDFDRVDDFRSIGSSELCRVSISSSCDESDAEPMYATVDITANRVSISWGSDEPIRSVFVIFYFGVSGVKWPQDSSLTKNV